MVASFIFIFTFITGIKENILEVQINHNMASNVTYRLNLLKRSSCACSWIVVMNETNLSFLSTAQQFQHVEDTHERKP